ncbi:MAG TPA: TolC family protein [Gemmatimonadales bacterium]|nr:TolC family protein [Gemmatimonadales bacterium]
MRFMVFAALLLPGLAAPAGAQQARVPARLSLADAIAIAREHNPAYRQAKNDRTPAAWGVRNAWSATFLPSLTAGGGVTYTGPGEQTFLTSSFEQDVSTISSYYNLSLGWELSGATLSQPGLARAQQRAVDADVAGAERLLIAGVTQQYLTVLQAMENAEVARKQLERNEEFLKLAQARFDVGRASLIDVRQAQVARGQAQVGLLRAQTAVSVEKLRLFEQLGVVAPVDVEVVELSDSFAVTAPTLDLAELLDLAAEHNPSLNALRARKQAATWGVRAATSSYGPALSLSAGWSGFTQQFTDVEPVIRSQQQAFGAQYNACQENNQIRQSAGLPPSDCSVYVWGAANEQAIRDRNSVFPFDFTRQPFQARLTVSLPLFTNFARPLRVSEAKAQEGDLAEAVRARGLAVRTEVSQAFLNLQTAYRATAIQDTSRTAAAEQLQLATERYRVGSGTFFELLDAQVASLRAEYDYVTAIYDYHRAVAALEAAVGRPLR